MTPHQRLAGSVDASRPCPGPAELRAAFRITRKRTLRRSDATVSVESIRYQVPQPWRHLREAWIRYARWDLSSVDLVDGRSGERQCTLYPLDKRANADGVRRRAGPGGDEGNGGAGAGELPPLLKGMLDAQAASGLPPAWLAHAVPLPSGRFGSEPHRPCRPASQAYAKRDLGPARDGDVLDQQPRHALSLAVRGLGVVPQAGEVDGQGEDPLSLGFVELAVLLATALLQLPAGVVEVTQPRVPLRLQDVGHESIVRMRLHEAPPCQLRFLTGPLDGLGAPGFGLFGARGQFVLDLERDAPG